MNPQFAVVWYASPKKFNGMFKVKALDDRGSIAISPDGIQFAGRKLNLIVTRIVAVSLARQQIPWPPMYSLPSLAFHSSR